MPETVLAAIRRQARQRADAVAFWTPSRTWPELSVPEISKIRSFPPLTGYVPAIRTSTSMVAHIPFCKSRMGANFDRSS